MHRIWKFKKLKRRKKRLLVLLTICLIFAILSLYVANFFGAFSRYSGDYYDPKDFERASTNQ
ncbi:MAG: hypothetical protein ACE5HO_03020 [bacterium]